MVDSHKHDWQIKSGSTDGYFSVDCWCGAWAMQSLSGDIYNVKEPTAEVRARQFEKREWVATPLNG